MKTTQHQKGFTLIETIIYISVVAIFLTSTILLAFEYVSGGQKARSNQEVQQNARFAMQRILQEIRGANDLSTIASVFGTNPGTLSLAHDTAGKNPVIFDVSGQRLRITQGAESPMFLTTDKVRVINLVFTNLSVNNKTKNIKVQMTIQAYNPAGISLLDAAVSLEGTAVIREQQ